MDDIETTTQLLIKCICTVICVGIVTTGGCVANSHRLVANAIAAGADPMKAACALDTPSSEKGICAIVVAKATP